MCFLDGAAATPPPSPQSHLHVAQDCNCNCTKQNNTICVYVLRTLRVRGCTRTGHADEPDWCRFACLHRQAVGSISRSLLRSRSQGEDFGNFVVYGTYGRILEPIAIQARPGQQQEQPPL
jgi:hypothetical protein